jgi:ABC-type multidrug transport system fused ATPase/permease subunit
MYDFYDENKTLVLISITASVMKAGLDAIIIPRTLANVFNSLTDVEQKGSEKFLEFRRTLLTLVMMWIMMKIIYALSNYCRKHLEPKITDYIINKLVNAVFNKYEAVNELSDVSILINKIHLIKKNLQELFFLLFTIFIPKLTVLVVSLMNITLLNTEIGVFLTTAIILQCYIVFNTYNQCLNTSYEEIESQDVMYMYLQDVFSNINIVQSTCNGYDKELETINKLTSDISDKENIALSCVNTQQNFSFASNLVVFMVVLTIIYYFYSSMYITNKDVVKIILSVNGMFENMYDFAYYVPETISRIGILRSNEEFVKELLSHMKDTDDIVRDLTLKSHTIIFKNVSFAYDHHSILNLYNVTIPENKIVGLYGQSGSGKTTFIKLIFGIFQPQEGEIYIGNIPITKSNCRALRKYICYMSQHSASLFDKSVLQNITYGYEDTDQQRIIDLFERFELYSVFKKLDGDRAKYSFLTNPCGKNGCNLSGGQKAIVHLLRLDLNDAAKIVILDEVTSALDNSSRDNIIEYIKYLKNKKKTILIISHDTFIDSIYDIKISFDSTRNPLIL